MEMHTTPLGYTIHTLKSATLCLGVHLTRQVYEHTIWMPHVTKELHRRWHERVVLGEFELGGENAAFVWCALGALNQCFPDKEVIFVDGAGGDAFWRVGGEVFVLLEETLGGDGVHGGLIVGGR